MQDLIVLAHAEADTFASVDTLATAAAAFAFASPQLRTGGSLSIASDQGCAYMLRLTAAPGVCVDLALAFQLLSSALLGILAGATDLDAFAAAVAKNRLLGKLSS